MITAHKFFWLRLVQIKPLYSLELNIHRKNYFTPFRNVYKHFHSVRASWPAESPGSWSLWTLKHFTLEPDQAVQQ